VKAVVDSTVLFHFNYQNAKMLNIVREKGITDMFITRINYIELLSGASENAKLYARKCLQPFKILEFDKAAALIASSLSMKYRVSAKHSKDFLIAAICIANNIPLLTENDKDYGYKEMQLLPYRINV
jgi:predicted nucleic acid-binding protein